MKHVRSILALAALALFLILPFAVAADQGAKSGGAAALTSFFIMDAACAVVVMRMFQLRECRLFTATLITSILTGKIIAPLRTNVPELDFFSVDWGRTGGEFAPPAKWGQEVISHMIAAPTAEAFTPGGGLGSNTQNPKDLLTDVKVKIDQAAKVSIKLTVADAIAYILSPAFKETLNQASISLGRYVVGKGVAKFTKANFSQEKVATVAAVEIETLGDVRAQMNKLGTLVPRFILGETDWVKTLSRDPVIQSGDYHGQLTTDDPYITLVNLEGFSKIREFPNMPTNNVAVGNATIANAGDLFTLAAHGLTNGTRIRLTNIVTSTGIETGTDYFVIGATTNTFQVSLTAGGAAVVIGTGDGTADVSKFEALNALAFEKRAVHIAFRQLIDNDEMADMLGIPKTNKKMVVTDDVTGVTVTWYFWQDNTGTNPTGDVYATAVVAFGVRAGRELTNPDTPATQAAGSGMDYGAVRIVETAAS